MARGLAALAVLARLAVAAVFLAAALPKIADPAGFVADLRNYQVFPHWSWTAIAGLVPMLEVVGAVALVIGWKRRAAAVLLGLLTTSFLILIGSVIARGIDLQCGCFGRDAAAESIGWPLFLRDVGLLALVGLAGREAPGVGAARAGDVR